VIHIDGSTHSGSGTLLRYAITLATLVGEPLHMVHIRAARPKPGLRPQHVESLRACAALSGGCLEGDAVGSDTISYFPGNQLHGGDFNWDIGTAGSATMLALTVIPLAFYARSSCRFVLQGGLFQDFAPSALHLREVLLPLVRRMGAEIDLKILRPGYVPKGHGRLFLEIKSIQRPLKPLRLPTQGKMERLHAISLASHLDEEKVSQRMAARCQSLLERRGYPVDLTVLQDTTAIQKGAVMLLAAETSTGCLLGADRAGKRGRSSESIAEFVVNILIEDLQTGATTDRFLADQLVLFAGLAEGWTEYVVPGLTEHINSNLWLVEKILGATSEMQGNLLKINGIGLSPNRF
jgi:RNA 3'-terminal phosphate cyclase (ATP)